MRTMRLLSCLFVFAAQLTVSGCGQTGALFLPVDAESDLPSSQQEASDETTVSQTVQ